MNHVAVFLHKLAKYALIIALVITLIGHFTQAHGFSEQIKEINEQKEEHIENDDDDGPYSTYHSSSDCKYCKEYNEAKAELNRSITTIWMNTLKTLLTYTISCGILYGVGEAVGYLGILAENTRKDKSQQN